MTCLARFTRRAREGDMEERKAVPIASVSQRLGFDDRNLRWHKLGDLEHFVFYVFDADPERGVIDFILKFEPNKKIILHRHLALTNTFVLQGEHRLYEPDGTLK